VRDGLAGLGINEEEFLLYADGRKLAQASISPAVIARAESAVG
jgi:hypothetical protein